VSGVYKLADCCISGQDMVMLRLTQLKSNMSDLLERLSVEHFSPPQNSSQKLPCLFLINNIHFIVIALS